MWQLVVVVGHLQESMPLVSFLASALPPCAPPHVNRNTLLPCSPLYVNMQLPPLYVNVTVSGVLLHKSRNGETGNGEWEIGNGKWI